jgi:hypothetical protein
MGALGIRGSGSAVRAGPGHYDGRSAVDRLLDGRAELAGWLRTRSGLRFPGRGELERGAGVLGPDHVDDRVDEGQVRERLREVAEVPPLRGSSSSA